MTSSSPPTAVVLNVTVTDPTQGSYLTVWPSNVGRPGTSDINFGAGETQSNLVIVGLSPTGEVSCYNQLGNGGHRGRR
jgi:serine protease